MSREPSENSLGEQSPRPTRVLLLIPDADLADLLQIALRAEGFLVTVGKGPGGGVDYPAEAADVAVVDSAIGKRAVLALMSDFRGQARLPIIVLTKLGDEAWIREDKETASISKPFSHRDLIVRIRALYSPAQKLSS